MIKKGRRVYPDQRGLLSLAEGDYGFDPIANEWFARPPGQSMCSLAGYEILEEENGTITVSPSILLTNEGDAKTRDITEIGNLIRRPFFDESQVIWHGFLERGVWREA